MSNIWFVSDTHFMHKNICIGVSEWDDKEKSCRNFQILEEMNELIINNINKYVKEDDILYHLGDWSFGGIDNIWEFRKQIKCKNIYLVPGNHDHNIKNNKQVNCSLYDYFQWLYPENTMNLSSNSDLVHTQSLFLEILPQCYKLIIDKKEVILSHFPLEEWENMDRGSIHLHGHCHHTKDYTDLNMYAKRMDVGMDWGEFRPYNWDEIKEIMKERKIKKRYE
jgi:calcineurin-like phosphoesterase family protein